MPDTIVNPKGMGKFMGVLDTLRLYTTEWEEIKKREFSEAECNLMLSCIVVTSQWGRSVMFQFKEGKKYIPLEPTAPVKIGDSLDPRYMELVLLEYRGSDPKRTGQRVFRIRISHKETPEVSFDDPFGLNG